MVKTIIKICRPLLSTSDPSKSYFLAALAVSRTTCEVDKETDGTPPFQNRHNSPGPFFQTHRKANEKRSLNQLNTGSRIKLKGRNQRGGSHIPGGQGPV